MSHGSHPLEVKHITIRIAKRLGIYYFCVGLDGCLEGFKVVHINNCIGNTLGGKRMSDEVI